MVPVNVLDNNADAQNLAQNGIRAQRLAMARDLLELQLVLLRNAQIDFPINRPD